MNMDAKKSFGSALPLVDASLKEAAVDFFHFQNRGYPRRSALQWVGNRYALGSSQRHLLLRGIFPEKDGLKRISKRARGSAWQKKLLVVDGHNVHITLESALLERPLILANDGAVRDLAGQSSSFRVSPVSEMALQLLMEFFRHHRPLAVLFLFDAPMSHSGQLAGLYRQELRGMGLKGDARTVPVPEREIPLDHSVVASSDHALLDASREWLDLARCTLNRTGLLHLAADFSELRMVRPPRGFPYMPVSPLP